MTDRELAQLVVQGRQQAFAEIVHRYSGMVFSKALGIMHTEEGAAEVTQQTFVRAYESIDACAPSPAEKRSWRTKLEPGITSTSRETPKRFPSSFVSSENGSHEASITALLIICPFPNTRVSRNGQLLSLGITHFQWFTTLARFSLGVS